MADGKILIAGIGNIFLGDDGFGSDVRAGWPNDRCRMAFA